MTNKITIDSEQAFSRKFKKEQGFEYKQYKDGKTGDHIYRWIGIKIVDWVAPTEEGQETLI
jgi:hypothetical protein